MIEEVLVSLSLFTRVYQLLTLALPTFWAKYSFISEVVLQIIKRIWSLTTYAQYQNDEVCVVILEEGPPLIVPTS